MNTFVSLYGILFVSFKAIVNDIAALTVSVTQNPIGILGNNTVNLVCKYSEEAKDIVYTITWQKKQTDTYTANDDIATFWPPNSGRNASFSTSTNPGKDLSSRAELVDPTSTKKTAVLKINRVTCEDEAEYRCVVDYYKDGTGSTSASTTIKMIVRARPSVPDSVPVINPSSNIVENTDVHFTCTGNVGRNPNGTFVWYKYVNNVLRDQWNAQQTNTLMDGTCTFNGSSSTTIRVTRDDDMMVIRCAIEQTGAGNTYFRQTEPIRVYYGVSRQPDITRDPSDSAGRTVTLTCKADGQPPPSYIWYVSKSNQIGTGYRYQIQNAQPSDSGTYTCMAYNTFPFDNSQSFNQNASALVIIVRTTPTSTTDTTHTTTIKTPKTTTEPTVNCGCGNGVMSGLVGGIIGFLLASILFVATPVIRRRLEKNDKETETYYQEIDVSSRQTNPQTPYDEIRARVPQVYVNAVMEPH